MEKEEIKNAILETMSEGDWLKDQLKEHLADATKKVKEQMVPEPVQAEAEEKAKGFKSFGDFLKSVRAYRKAGTKDNRLTYVGKATTGHLEEGEDSYGGFLVPEIYRNELMEIAQEGAVVRPRATIIPMTTDSVKIPYVNETSRASSLFGGVIAYWTAEAAAKTASAPSFGQMELTPHKLAGLTYVSDELLADSFLPVEGLVRRQFGQTWGWYEDYAYLRGTGAGQPLGVLNCGGIKTVYRNTVNRIHAEDIAEMYQGMLPTSFNKAEWFAHPRIMSELLELGSGNAADASGKILIWQPNFKDGIGGWQILGRPVTFTEKLPELGTTGDLVFADFSYYLIGDRQPITIDVSTHLRFDYDETVFRFVLRVAGQCWPASAITLKSGTHTISPFVVLSGNTS